MAGTYEYDLGTEIAIEEGTIGGAHVGTGWVLANGSVNKIGPLVALHLEFSFADGASATALTLPDENFWPQWDVHTPDGKFVISAEDGNVGYTGSTVTHDDGPIVCEAIYDPFRGH